MAKLSVIILVYGVEKYIERCAISLFEQTLDDIEFIFVNDCTKDNSIEILKMVLERYPQRTSQVKVIDLPTNCGQAIARKYGMDMASGEYIIHCDSDDWVHPMAYEKLYSKAKTNDSDIVFCDFYISDGKNHKTLHRRINVNSRDSVLIDVSRNVCWSLCGAMVRRSLYSDNDIVFPKFNNGEDFALMFQYIYYANNFSKVDEPLYYYYMNSESITNIPSVTAYIKRYNQFKQNTDLVISFIAGHKKSSNSKKIVQCYKLYSRTKLSPLVREERYFELWQSTYPELTFWDIMTNSIIPIRTRLHYIAVNLRIYHLLRK